MSLPPGPTSPALWQGLGWLRDPLAQLRDARARYGSTFTLRFPPGPTVFTSDPVRCREVFLADPAVVSPGLGNFVALPFLGPHALVVLDGEAHRRQRRPLQPAFTAAHLRPLANRVAAFADAELDRWPEGGRVSARPFAERVSLRAVVEAVAGPPEPALLAAVEAVIAAVSVPLVFIDALHVDLGPWSPWGRFRVVRDRLHAALDVRFDAGDIGPDLVSHVLRARPPALSREELRAQVLTLLFAGVETTAASLAWALCTLGAHPEIQAQTADEVAGLDPEALITAPLLGRVVNETLRLHQPLPVAMRKVLADLPFGPWTLPAGSFVAPSMYLLHRDPEFFPDPEVFRPERFEGPPSPAWLPFGDGARKCLGRHLADLVLRVATGRVVQRFRLHAPGPVPTERGTVTIFPSTRHRLRVSRHPAHRRLPPSAG